LAYDNLSFKQKPCHGKIYAGLSVEVNMDIKQEKAVPGCGKPGSVSKNWFHPVGWRPVSILSMKNKQFSHFHGLIP
jgi:hypothetical protein